MIEPVWLATTCISVGASEPTVTRLPATSTEAVRSFALKTISPSSSAEADSSTVIGMPEIVTLVSVSELKLIKNQIVNASRKDIIIRTMLWEKKRTRILLFFFIVLLLSVLEQHRKQVVLLFVLHRSYEVGELFVQGIPVEILYQNASDGDRDGSGLL